MGKLFKYLVFTIFIVLPSALYADIYVYMDKNGILSFTNVPVSSDYKFYMEEDMEDLSSLFISSHPLDNILKYSSSLTGLEMELIKAVIEAESGFIKNAVSKKGAKGLMQLMPVIIKKYRVKNPFDPKENIMAGSRYLKSLVDKYDGNLKRAVAAYNCGPGTIRKYKGIPPYKETRNYVKKVFKNYEKYKDN